MNFWSEVAYAFVWSFPITALSFWAGYVQGWNRGRKSYTKDIDSHWHCDGHGFEIKGEHEVIPCQHSPDNTTGASR